MKESAGGGRASCVCTVYIDIDCFNEERAFGGKGRRVWVEGGLYVGFGLTSNPTLTLTLTLDPIHNIDLYRSIYIDRFCEVSSSLLAASSFAAVGRCVRKRELGFIFTILCMYYACIIADNTA